MVWRTVACVRAGAQTVVASIAPHTCLTLVWPAAQCFTFEESGDCKFGDRCRFRHGEEDSRFDASGCRDLSTEVCRDFNAGRCRLGDACPRQHIEQAEQPKRERKPRGGGGDGDDGERTRKPRKPREVKKIDEICENYAAGRCRYGDQCRRVHQGDIAQTVEKLDEVCNNFLEGRCRFGDMCRRIHPAQ